LDSNADMLASKDNKAIGMVYEYRRALVLRAVNGKIDVRGKHIPKVDVK